MKATAKLERNEQIITLRAQGITYKALAEQFRISAVRAFMIVREAKKREKAIDNNPLTQGTMGNAISEDSCPNERGENPLTSSLDALPNPSANAHDSPILSKG